MVGELVVKNTSMSFNVQSILKKAYCSMINLRTKIVPKSNTQAKHIQSGLARAARHSRTTEAVWVQRGDWAWTRNRCASSSLSHRHC